MLKMLNWIKLMHILETATFYVPMQKALTERELQIITMRYGLKDGEEKNRTELAQEIGIPRERIRQLEVRAIRKLRSIWIKSHEIPAL